MQESIKKSTHKSQKSVLHLMQSWGREDFKESFKTNPMEESFNMRDSPQRGPTSSEDTMEFINKINGVNKEPSVKLDKSSKKDKLDFSMKSHNMA